MLSIREQKHLDILNAAESLMRSRSYGGISMDTVAHEAHVSKRTLYQHFATKQALFDEVCESLIARIPKIKVGRFDANSGTKAQLTKLALEETNLLRHVDVVCLLHWALQADTELSLQRVMSLGLLGKQVKMAKWLQQAVDANKLLITDVEVAAQQFVSIIHGHFLLAVLNALPNQSSSVSKADMKTAMGLFMAHYKANA